MGNEEFFEMKDFIDCFLEVKMASKTAIKMAEDLPDDNALALSIISTMIDAYCTMHKLNTREIWKHLYEVSGLVYEEQGPMILKKGGGKIDPDNLNI